MKKLGLAVTLAICLFAACDKSTSSSGASAAKVAPGAATAAPAPGTATPAPVTPSTATAAGEIAGTKYGKGVTQPTTVSVEEVLANPQAYANKPIRVEGMVTDVCPKRGCWFELAGSAPGQKLKFKVTDGDMVFPMDAKGKVAIAQGEVSVRELTLEETKQNAEYEAKEYGKAYDPASITTPKIVVRIDGTGAVFRDKI